MKQGKESTDGSIVQVGDSSKTPEAKERSTEGKFSPNRGSGNSSTVLAGSVESGKNNNIGIFTSDSSAKVSDVGKLNLKNIKPLEELSGRKELGELKNHRNSKGTPKRAQNSSRLQNTSVMMDGGDVDVKSYIKNIKQLEQEKQAYKRELMGGSNSSKSSQKFSKSAMSNYTKGK